MLKEFPTMEVALASAVLDGDYVEAQTIAAFIMEKQKKSEDIRIHDKRRALLLSHEKSLKERFRVAGNGLGKRGWNDVLQTVEPRSLDGYTKAEVLKILVLHCIGITKDNQWAYGPDDMHDPVPKMVEDIC